LTGSEPLGVSGGAKDVEEVFLRRVRYKTHEPIAFFPGVKWPHSMRADGQHRHAAVAFGDLLLDLGCVGAHKRSCQETNYQSATNNPSVGREHKDKSPNLFHQV
jgi:hypothetical protein